MVAVLLGTRDDVAAGRFGSTLVAGSVMTVSQVVNRTWVNN